MTFDVHSFMFYVFAFLVMFSGVMVISSKNPVHSVLFLIFAFFNAAGLILLLGAEYIAMTLVIVYVGAVAVLFLFVVMMLNVDFAQWRQGFTKNLPLGLGMAFLFILQIGLIYKSSMPTAGMGIVANQPMPSPETVTNVVAVGRLLYTDYAFAFQTAGLILLVAMISAIVLTLRHRPGVRRQKIAVQVARKREDSIAVVSVKSGKGMAS